MILDIKWDSLDDVEKHLQRLKNRLNVLRSEKNGSQRERLHKAMDAVDTIYRTDISSVYADFVCSNERKFYVYAHLDPTTDIHISNGSKKPSKVYDIFSATIGLKQRPFYIGKGSGNRISKITRNETHKKFCEKIKRFGKEPTVFIIKDNLTEKEALMLEDKLIDIYGLHSFGGLLSNLHEGYRPGERRTHYLEQFKELKGKSVSLYEIS